MSATRPPRTLFRVHALQRMFERRIGVEDVLHVVATGETIEEYPSDTPFPSRLILGWIGTRPLHVVAARDPTSDDRIIITAYEPDQEIWESGFRRRK